MATQLVVEQTFHFIVILKSVKNFTKSKKADPVIPRAEKTVGQNMKGEGNCKF